MFNAFIVNIVLSTKSKQIEHVQFVNYRNSFELFCAKFGMWHLISTNGHGGG